MPEQDPTKFSLTEGLLHGVPLSRSKDVAAWEQREKLIELQKSIEKGVQARVQDVAKLIQTGQMSQDQARAEITAGVGTTVHELLGEGGVLAGISRHAEICQQGFQEIINQNDRRDVILASVDAGIQGLIKESVDQTTYQATLVVQSKAQIKLGLNQLLTSHRTNELIAGMAHDLAEKIDFTNINLTAISDQLNDLLDHLSQVVTTGFGMIDERLGATNSLLEEVLKTLKSPEEIAIRESLSIALRLLRAGNFRGAIERFKKTNPDTHDFEIIHLLLGYAFLKVGDGVSAAHYLGWAKRYALEKKNIDVAENASILLARMALELGDYLLAIEALKTLVEDKNFAPFLKRSHAEFAAVQAIAGYREKAIESTIDQIVTNPNSVDQIIESTFISVISQDEEKWSSELMEIILRSTARHSHLPYLALSLFAFARLEMGDLAKDLLRTVLHLWKKQLRPLNKKAFQAEVMALSPLHYSHYYRLLSEVAKEPEFTWLK